MARRRLRCDLLGRGLCEFQLRLRLGLPFTGHAHAFLRSLLGISGGRELRGSRIGGSHRGVELLLADNVLLDEGLIAFKVGLGLDVVGLRLDDAGLRGQKLLACLLDGGMRAAEAGIGRTQIAAGVDCCDGHIHVGCGGVGLSAGKRGLSIFHRNLIIRRIEFGNHVSGLDDLILLDIDLENLAGDARADLNQMAVDLRVIGVFAISGAPPNAQSNQREHHDYDYDDASAAGVRLRARALIVRLGGNGCWD